MNIRFHASPYERMMMTLPRNYLLQNIGYRLFKDRPPFIRNTKVFRDILEIYYRSYPTPHDRYEQLRELCERIYARLCPDAVQSDSIGAPFDIERHIGAEAINRHYRVPSTTSDTKRNIKKIQGWLERKPEAVHSIFDSFGFKPRSVHALTRLELTIAANALSRTKRS